MPADKSLDSDNFPGHEAQPRVVGYHVKIMHEAGLLDVIDCSTSMAPNTYTIEEMTEGQDFLDKIRAETVWEKIKAATSKHGVGLSIELIKALAAEYGAKVLGLKA